MKMKMKYIILASLMGVATYAGQFTATDGSLYDIGTVDGVVKMETPKQYVNSPTSFSLVEKQIIYSPRIETEPITCTTDSFGREFCPDENEKEQCADNYDYSSGSSSGYSVTRSYLPYCSVTSDSLVDGKKTCRNSNVTKVRTKCKVELSLSELDGNGDPVNTKVMVGKGKSGIKFPFDFVDIYGGTHTENIKFTGSCVAQTWQNIKYVCGSHTDWCGSLTDLFRCEIDDYCDDWKWADSPIWNSYDQKTFNFVTHSVFHAVTKSSYDDTCSGTRNGNFCNKCSGGYSYQSSSDTCRRPSNCPFPSLKTSPGVCKDTYTYYDYSCPTTINIYGNGWNIKDVGGDCGASSCTNPSVAPSDNCTRLGFLCPHDSSKLCKKEGGDITIFEPAKKFSFKNDTYKPKEYGKLRGFPCTTESDYNCEFGVTKIVSDEKEICFTDTRGFRECIGMEPDNNCSLVGTIDGRGTPIQQLLVSSDMHGIYGTFASAPIKKSCSDYLGNPSGIYRIDPDGAGGKPGFDAYCDMTTSGGGWTMVLRAGPDDTKMDYGSTIWTEGGTYNQGAVPTIESVSAFSDRSGNGHLAVPKSGAVLKNLYPPYLDVSSPKAHLDVGSKDMDFSTGFTISQKVDLSSVASHGGIIFNNEVTYELAIFPDGEIKYALFEENASQWYWQSTGHKLSFGGTYEIAFRYDGSTNSVALFVDGAKKFFIDNNATAVPSKLIHRGNNLLFGERGSAFGVSSTSAANDIIHDPVPLNGSVRIVSTPGKGFDYAENSSGGSLSTWGVNWKQEGFSLTRSAIKLSDGNWYVKENGAKPGDNRGCGFSTDFKLLPDANYHVASYTSTCFSGSTNVPNGCARDITIDLPSGLSFVGISDIESVSSVDFATSACNADNRYDEEYKIYHPALAAPLVASRVGGGALTVSSFNLGEATCQYTYDAVTGLCKESLGSSQSLNGKFYSIEIHNKPISDVDISSIASGYPSSDGLVARYDFVTKPSIKNEAFNSLKGTEYMLCFKDSGALKCVEFGFGREALSYKDIFREATMEFESTTNATDMLALIDGSNVQSGSRILGTNLRPIRGNFGRLRIGMAGNNEANDESPDSGIGLGMSYPNVLSGNRNTYGDNATDYVNRVSIPRTGFLFIRDKTVSTATTASQEIRSECLLSGKVGFSDQRVSISAVSASRNRLNFWNSYIGGDIGHIDVVRTDAWDLANTEMNGTLISDVERDLFKKGFTGFFKGANGHTYASSLMDMSNATCLSKISGTSFHVATADLGSLDKVAGLMTCGVTMSLGTTGVMEAHVGSKMSAMSAEFEVLDAQCNMKVTICGASYPTVLAPGESVNALSVSDGCGGKSTEFKNIGATKEITSTGEMSAEGEARIIRSVSNTYNYNLDTHCLIESDIDVEEIYGMKFLKRLETHPDTGFYCSNLDCLNHVCQSASCENGFTGTELRSEDLHYLDPSENTCTGQKCDMAHLYYASCGTKNGCPLADDIFKADSSFVEALGALHFETTDPNWVVNEALGEYKYTKNGPPTMLLNTEPIYVSPTGKTVISAEIMVDTRSDNDFIGIAFGRKASGEYYSLMWGQDDADCNLAGTERGLSLSYNTEITSSWCQETGGKTTVLKKRKGYYYEDLKWYAIKIAIEGKSVVVSINGTQVLDYTFASFADFSGSVGLLNSSQDGVVYRKLSASSSDGQEACYKASCDDPNAIFNSDKGVCTIEGCAEDSFLEGDGKCYKKSY